MIDSADSTITGKLPVKEAPKPEWPAYRPWPTLHEDALQGLAGIFVRLVEPETEADPAALLVQYLTMFGCAAGLSPHVFADGKQHRGRLYTLIVGTTSRGKKGTSLAHVSRVFALADETWSKRGRIRGLASGEGLITHFCPTDENAEPTEKRGLFISPEFVRVFAVCSRDGSILGSLLRDLWDDERIETMLGKGARSADDCHLSVIGHITPGELLQNLQKTTDVVNGFLNRYLLICSERKRVLPDGGNIAQHELDAHAGYLRSRINFAHTTGRMSRSTEAARLWNTFYRELPDLGDTTVGNMLARAEPQVLRLSIVYALLDHSSVIDVEHLRAAIAVWDYAATSVAHIFSAESGNRKADKILPHLRNAYPGSLTRTEIYKIVGGNVPAAEVTTAVDYLVERNLAVMINEQTERPGRPPQRLRAVCKVVPMR
jgi:hypothetical protein